MIANNTVSSGQDVLDYLHSSLFFVLSEDSLEKNREVKQRVKEGLEFLQKMRLISWDKATGGFLCEPGKTMSDLCTYAAVCRRVVGNNAGQGSSAQQYGARTGAPAAFRSGDSFGVHEPADRPPPDFLSGACEMLISPAMCTIRFLF